MKLHVRRLFGIPVSVAGLALLTALATATTAAAATTTNVTYDIQSSAAGQTASNTLSFSVTDNQPASVAAGAALTDVLSVGAATVPSSASGYTIKQIQNIKLLIPVPSNSTYVSASLSGGSGLGSGTPTVSQSGGIITINVPGPIAGGSTFTLPTLTINLTAGSSGSTISTTLYGTSYSNPGLTFTPVIVVLGFNVNGSSAGYPTPSPVLGTTTIS